MEIPGLEYRNTGKNLGGAGGFCYGIRQAAAAGYDALWLMDDDTIPEPDALARFLEADTSLQGKYGWLSSRALAPDGTDQPMNLQRVDALSRSGWVRGGGYPRGNGQLCLTVFAHANCAQ